MLPSRATFGDIAKLTTTAALGLSGFAPKSVRPPVVKRSAALMQRAALTTALEMTQLIGRVLPEASAEEGHWIAEEMQRTRIENVVCRGAGIFGRNWPAEIEVRGIEHLEHAHARGRGVVMWLMSFLDATPFNLVAAGAGHPVTHLSAVDHLVSGDGRVSQAFVAPLLLRGEVRSQAGRIVIPSGGGLGYVRDLRSVLEEDRGTISIRGDFTLGRRMVDAPHLGGVASFPTGAPSLAHQTGAVLLTTATVRRGPFEHAVIIDEPISVRRDLDRRAFQRAAVQEFAARLDSRARTSLTSRPWQPFLEWGRSQS